MAKVGKNRTAMPSSRFMNSMKAAIGSESIALQHKAMRGRT